MDQASDSFLHKNSTGRCGMKKILLIAISAVSLFSLEGCSKSLFPVAPPATASVLPTAHLMGQWRGDGTVSLSNPTGIAVDAGGNVYVADADLNQVVKFDSNGTLLG